MMSIYFKGVDANELLREIQKDIETDLTRNPEKALDSHIGETIKGTCSKCGATTIEVLPNGRAKCTKCELITQVKLSISYK